MKNILYFLVFISFSVNAQQKIKVDPMYLTQVKIKINPNDTVWRNFKLPESQFNGVPFFVADVNAKYYSQQEVAEFKEWLDRILNPDGYFATQEAYITFRSKVRE